MTRADLTRRGFLRTAGLAACAVCAGSGAVIAAAAGEKQKLHLATNQYPWGTFYRREGKKFEEDLDAGLAAVASTGLEGYEPLATSPQDIDTLSPLLKKHGLQMRSLYVNSTLHERDAAEKSIAAVLAIAARAKEAGARIIVTNPNPIKWGGAEDKTDDQLRTQAGALDLLGRRLAELGLVLSYHNHDVELRNAAREFHHMMVGTDPKNVTLCLDAHWVFRGAGNSAVAVYDIVSLYGRRVSELHARQSSGGTWTEAFGEGDIDYARIVKDLVSQGVRPHVVLEQAVEQATPKTLSAVDAHRRGAEYARQVFAAFSG